MLFRSETYPLVPNRATVYFAMKYQSIRPDLKPIGTMAHELMMATAAFMGPKEANYYVMRHWAEIYGGAMGTMLPDCFTTRVFLRNFSLDMAKLYDGVRHDSGDPFEFGDKIIAKYESYHIDPMTKSIVFSDALDFDRALAIQNKTAIVFLQYLGLFSGEANVVLVVI